MKTEIELSMPKYCIIGKGLQTNRKRKHIYQAFDEAAAIAMAQADNTAVEEVSILPNTPASAEQVAYAKSLGLTLPVNPDRSMVVASVLSVLAEKRRKACIVYSSDLDGDPWSPTIEPYRFQKHKRGIRLRCWVYEPKPARDVVADYQTEGWHLYLVDDIESAFDIGESFAPHEYRLGTTNEFTIRISIEGFNLDDVT